MLELSLDGGSTYATIAESFGKDAEAASVTTSALAPTTDAIVRLRVGETVAATSARFAIRAAPEKLEILRPKLDGLESGTAVPGDKGTLEARGGVPPFIRWTIEEGELPPGVRLDPIGGVLFGRPMRAGKYRFVIALTDAAASPREARRSVSIDVADAPPELLTPDEIPRSAVGNVYHHELATRGGTLPLHFSIVDGALPPGLSMDEHGVISGRPTVAGTSRIVVEVKDASESLRRTTRSYGIAIAPAPLHSDGPELGTFRVGEAIDLALPIGGGKPPYRVRALGGVVPDGLDLSAGGRLAGKPESAGTFIFSIAIDDAAGTSTHQGYRLTIDR